MLSNKAPHGEYSADKYYIAYLSGGLRPLHIIIKDIKLYTNHMNVLADELLNTLKYRIRLSLYLKKINKKGFYSKPAYNNEYIRTKMSSYNENFRDFKNLTKDEYCGHSILLLESICEV